MGRNYRITALDHPYAADAVVHTALLLVQLIVLIFTLFMPTPERTRAAASAEQIVKT